MEVPACMLCTRYVACQLQTSDGKKLTSEKSSLRTPTVKAADM